MPQARPSAALQRSAMQSLASPLSSSALSPLTSAGGAFAAPRSNSPTLGSATQYGYTKRS